MTAPRSPALAHKAFKVIRIEKDPRNILDPCPDFDFVPPRDSDELYDALRAGYPKGRTHRERMMEAVLDFIDQEEPPTSSRKAKGVPKKEFSNQLPTKSLNSCQDQRSLATASRTSVSSHAGKKRPWQKMISSWNSTVGSSPARPREPMTIQQRQEYRIRRGIGACKGCRRKKKKVCLLSPGIILISNLLWECIHLPVEGENTSNIMTGASNLSIR
jgi:hypothetical protein